MNHMPSVVIGLIWATAFVVLESIQFVYFGGLFQQVNSFLFGFCVLGLTSVFFVGMAWLRTPGQIKLAFQNPGLLLRVNATAAFAWIAFLGSVQLIEPAIAYTIGAGVMPITAYLLHRFGWPEGEAMRNRTELLGNVIIACALLLLGVVTLAGFSGFVRGDSGAAILGVTLAIADGVLFTILLAYCQRMDRSGVGPSAVFGLRFPLYVLTAGMFAFATITPADLPTAPTLMTAIVMGTALIVPPLYALQRAVALIPTMTLSAITATGPFVIFALQIVEGRVAQSGITLGGLCIYFAGAIVAATGAVKATIEY